MSEAHPRILACCLVLNEKEWLVKNYIQHQDLPGLVGIVYVEAADAVYAQTNPNRVSPAGLSMDGTTETLAELARLDSHVTYIPHGLATHSNPAQGKCQARNRYLEVAAEVKPDWLLIIDGDEFYAHADQRKIAELLPAVKPQWQGLMLRQRHVWRPPSVAASQSLFAQEVTGGYWDIPHCRLWRWTPDACYRDNHNDPYPRPRIMRLDHDPERGQCVHLGFASAPAGRAAKHRYYEARGEGRELRGRNRQDYVNCRAAWESWQPGDKLPHAAQVVPYAGPVPEVFQQSPQPPRTTNVLGAQL